MILVSEARKFPFIFSLGEALQFAIEAQDDVERCFVHLDYEYSQ